ncbi:hypothetical protein ZYGR_0U01140 [Zygosaccharomyces rouxii]|uniref:DNA-directed RNA polymerase III subunit RPC4 n=1 Tax=Zygosaccharomyces rouxii TaxID=4956 RepID=A0A1Q3A3K7_ZYGRO|nr:hypothetical protein ZYGR_0U01140 [Zygosaccharomyces rouxii]
MSSDNGPGRLPSLKNAGAGKPGLKFKPKVAARRSKEEREASAPKLESDEGPKPNDKKKPMNKRMTGPGSQNRRMARYLNNTHVVSTGPLAAGNFVGDKGGGPKRAFTKLEGGGGGASPLVLQGLKKMGGNDDDDDDEEDDEGGEDDEDKKKSSAQNRFNMGKEYSIHDLNGSEDEEGEGTPDMDEETWRALKTEELFPIRPVRYRHQDLEVLQNVDKEASTSDLTTREPTPAALKQEPVDSANELQDTLKQKDSELHKKLNELSLAQEFQSLDQNEFVAEVKSMTEDHDRIWKKLNKINNKPNRFVLFQLPPKLPEFEHNVIRPEPIATEQPTEVKEDDDGKKTTKKKDAEPAEPLPPLAGRIGSIRVHKSGRLSAKIGNVVMDISRGTETTFLQDAVTINQSSDTPPFAELLGRVDGRVVMTPRF